MARASASTCTIAVGAAAPTPVRAVKAEALLRGKKFTPEAIAAAAEKAVTEIKPIDDVHGTAWYRRQLTQVLTARVLRERRRPGRGGVAAMSKITIHFKLNGKTGQRARLRSRRTC